jgi:hypothetical protein
MGVQLSQNMSDLWIVDRICANLQFLLGMVSKNAEGMVKSGLWILLLLKQNKNSWQQSLQNIQRKTS